MHARREQKQKHSQARERKNSQARLVSVQSSLEDSPSGFRESPGYELNPGLGRAERRQQRQRDLDKMQSRFRSGLREQKRSREQKNAPGLSLEGTGSALAQVARLGAVCDSTKTSVVIATLGGESTPQHELTPTLAPTPTPTLNLTLTLTLLTNHCP